MTAEANSLFEAALKLPEADRMVLAERLLDTVSAEVVPPYDAAWESELERRADEMDHSDDAGVSWDELRREQ